MSYNITGFRVKGKINLIIPPDLVKKYLKGKTSKFPKYWEEEDGEWFFNRDGEGVTLSGHMNTAGDYVVDVFSAGGEFSGHMWSDMAEPLLRDLAKRDNLNKFKVTIVWEGGDSIEHVEVKDGKYTSKSEDDEDEEEGDEEDEEAEDEEGDGPVPSSSKKTPSEMLDELEKTVDDEDALKTPDEWKKLMGDLVTLAGDMAGLVVSGADPALVARADALLKKAGERLRKEEVEWIKKGPGKKLTTEDIKKKIPDWIKAFTFMVPDWAATGGIIPYSGEWKRVSKKKVSGGIERTFVPATGEPFILRVRTNDTDTVIQNYKFEKTEEGDEDDEEEDEETKFPTESFHEEDEEGDEDDEEEDEGEEIWSGEPVTAKYVEEVLVRKAGMAINSFFGNYYPDMDMQKDWDEKVDKAGKSVPERVKRISGSMVAELYPRDALKLAEPRILGGKGRSFSHYASFADFLNKFGFADYFRDWDLAFEARYAKDKGKAEEERRHYDNKPSDFYFSPMRLEDDSDEVGFAIVEKKTWDKEGFWDDQGVDWRVHVPEGVSEDCESMYSVVDISPEEAFRRLEDAGFTYEPDIVSGDNELPADALKDIVDKAKALPKKKCAFCGGQYATTCKLCGTDVCADHYGEKDYKTACAKCAGKPVSPPVVPVPTPASPARTGSDKSPSEMLDEIEGIAEDDNLETAEEWEDLLKELGTVSAKIPAEFVDPGHWGRRELEEERCKLVARKIEARIKDTKKAEKPDESKIEKTIPPEEKGPEPVIPPGTKVRVTKTGYFAMHEWIESDKDTAVKANPDFYVVEGETAVVLGELLYLGVGTIPGCYRVSLDNPGKRPHVTGIPLGWMEVISVMSGREDYTVGVSTVMQVPWAEVKKNEPKYRQLQEARIFSVDGKVYAVEIEEGESARWVTLDTGRRPFVLRVSTPASCWDSFKAVMERLGVRASQLADGMFVIEGEPDDLFKAVRTWGVKHPDCRADISQLSGVEEPKPAPPVEPKPASVAKLEEALDDLAGPVPKKSTFKKIKKTPPAPVIDIKWVVVTLSKAGTAGGAMRFEMGTQVAYPNFMDMNYRPEHVSEVQVAEGRVTSIVIGSATYRVEFTFSVGQEVKAYSTTTAGKRLRFISGYSSFKVTGIAVDKTPPSSMSVSLPSPPVVPPTPAPLDEAVAEEEEPEGVVVKPVTPVALKEDKARAIANKYSRYAELAEKQGFVKAEIDSMDYPDKTMIFGTAIAVKRRLVALGAPKVDLFVPEPATTRNEWHVPYKDLPSKAKKITVAVADDTDLHVVDVWEFPGPTKIDIGRLEKALRVLGQDVKFRITGDKDSVVIVEADDMAVAISPASYLKSKGGAAKEIPPDVKETLLEMAGIDSEAEMKGSYNFEFASFTPDEIVGWGTTCGRVKAAAFTPEVADFLKKQSVVRVMAIVDPVLHAVSSGTTEPLLSEEAGERLSVMIEKNHGSWRYDHGYFESE